MDENLLTNHFFFIEDIDGRVSLSDVEEIGLGRGVAL